MSGNMHLSQMGTTEFERIELGTIALYIYFALCQRGCNVSSAKLLRSGNQIEILCPISIQTTINT